MIKALAVLFGMFPALAAAAVLNVEFNFTPHSGDPEKQDVIVFVRGQAHIFVNGLPWAEFDVREQKYKIIFADREITSAPIMVTATSFGSLLRKGRNTLRVAFSPADPKAAYSVELRWAAVTDGVTETRTGKGVTSTNLAQQGRERKAVRGGVIMEREFQADFATDHAWHHYPPVKELSDADRQQIGALLTQRLQALQPDFKVFYEWLVRNEFNVAEIRKDRVLEKIHAAGLVVRMADAERLTFITAAGPGVMVKPPSREPLYRPGNPSVLSKLPDKGAQEFASSVLPRLFPTRLVVARTPAGVWEAVE